MIETLKQNIDIVELIERYTEFRGHGNCLQAKVNPLREEKTASFSVYRDTQKWKDFGSGEHGDIIDFIERAEGLSRIEAIKFLSDAYAIGFDGFTTHTPTAAPVVVEPIRKEISLSKYDKLSKLQTFKHEGYRSSALSIVPMWVYQQASKEALTRFKELTMYDDQYRSIVLKITDVDGKVVSTKHRRKNDIKWCTAKDTSANICLYDVKPSDVSVYVVEGHRDYLTAILLGLPVVMIPTVNYKTFNEYELSLFTGKLVHFLPDLKRGDRAGAKIMTDLANQLDGIASHITINKLSDVLIDSLGIDYQGNKLDLSDTIGVWTDTSEYFKTYITYYCECRA